jgi:hypothetical protein
MWRKKHSVHLNFVVYSELIFIFFIIIIIMANKSGSEIHALKLLKVHLQRTVDEAIAFGFKLVGLASILSVVT